MSIPRGGGKPPMATQKLVFHQKRSSVTRGAMISSHPGKNDLVLPSSELRNKEYWKVYRAPVIGPTSTTNFSSA